MIAIAKVVWTFLKSPIGKYLMIGLACVGLIVAFSVWNRSAQAAKDAPWITDPATKAKWKDEAEAAQRDLATCHGNETRLGSDLQRQNEATDAAKAQGDRMAAEIAAARQAARKSAVAAQSAGDALQSYKAKGANACARLLDVDAQVREIQP